MMVQRSMLAGAVLLTLCTSARAADVSGRFTVQGGGTIAPRYAAAFETRDQRNPRQRVVEVVLSSQPIDVDGAMAALSPHTHVINQDALEDSDYILVWVRPDGHVSMNATFGQSMTQYLDAVGETLAAQIATNTAERVAARVFSPKPVTTLDGKTYSIDVTFSAAVTRPAAGTPLPEGGGDPGKALAALDAALTTRNWAGIKAGLAPDTVARFEASYRTPEENTDYAVDILRAWLPKKALKVTGGELRGDVAVLEVEGDMFEGQKGLYLARMKNTGTAWQLEQAVVAGMLD